MRKSALYTSSIYSLSFFNGRKTTFHRESVSIQPVKQCGLPEDPCVWILGGMDVRV